MALALNVEEVAAVPPTPTFELAVVVVGLEDDDEGKPIELAFPLLDVVEVPDTVIGSNEDEVDVEDKGAEDGMEDTWPPPNPNRSRIVLQACRIRSVRPADDSSLIPDIGDRV